MKINIFSILKGIVIGIIIVAFGGGAFYGGYQLGVSNKEVIIAGVINQETGKPTDVDFDLFWETWKLIRQSYFKSNDVDNQTLLYGAVRGLVASLEDPHSNFLTPKDSKRFAEDISGEFSGVGMEIAIRDNNLTVVAPLKDTPADRAGIRSGDIVLQVDNSFTSGISIDEAVTLIRGPKGTFVRLLVMREGWDSPREFEVKRDVISIPPIEYTLLDNDIAHVQLFNFNENVPYSFYKSSVDLLIDRPKGIILDLRNNPGGFLEVSVNVAGWFLDKGDIVTKEAFRSGEHNVFRSSGNGALSHLPVVVLVNEGSASAAEILAGALRDHRNAPLIGMKTFGKGSVQEIKQLSDESALKLSIAQWLTPNDSLIDGVGIEPDFIVELTADDIENEQDPQLQKAIEVLEDLINK